MTKFRVLEDDEVIIIDGPYAFETIYLKRKNAQFVALYKGEKEG